MGGAEGGGSTSPFRVGESVDLVRVLAMVSALVVCIMLAERAVHRALHRLQRHPKYREMLTKAFGELTILGLIGLGLKLLKEVPGLDAYSPRMVAFQAADLLVFLVAIALILQAAVVFLRLRRKNIQAEKAELLSTQHLVDMLARTGLPTWYHEFKAIFDLYAPCCRRPRRRRRRAGQPLEREPLTSADIPEVARLRILRHFFLKSYGLPELFPFSKYLRQAQDNQISHMIEVNISTWMVLLLIAWGLASVAKLVDHKYHTPYNIVVAFLIFSWASVLLHIAITAYFTWAIDQLLDAAVDERARATDRYLYLNEIAEHEAATADRELAGDAIATMEGVREHEQMKRVRRKRNVLSERDTGFQLVGTIFRKVKQTATTVTRQAADGVLEAGGAKPDDAEPVPPVQGPPVQLRWFSRKAWHFVVMSTLMLNGLYVALFCQCVIYHMTALSHAYGRTIVWFLPLPLLLNMLVFQPRILRNYILGSSIVRVDDKALGDVIDHFTETVQLRAGFVQSVHAYLESTDQTVADIESEFKACDPSGSGLLDSEDVRLVLHRFGFKLTYFRFNSVAKLLFDLRGIKIEYAQVIRLLEIGRSDDVRSLANGSTFLGEFSSTPSSAASSALPARDTVYETSPYVSGATNLRHDNLLLRAKSSAANSLYRMSLDEPTSSSPGGTQHVTL